MRAARTLEGANRFREGSKWCLTSEICPARLLKEVSAADRRTVRVLWPGERHYASRLRFSGNQWYYPSGASATADLPMTAPANRSQGRPVWQQYTRGHLQVRAWEWTAAHLLVDPLRPALSVDLFWWAIVDTHHADQWWKLVGHSRCASQWAGLALPF
jgi:hypothetical protein